MRIAFFEIEKWEIPFIKEELKGHQLFFSEKPLTKNLARKIKDFEALSLFVYCPINEEIINLLPKLKLITTRSTGYDHIDLEVCRRKGITVCNVPTYGENTVAEHTFALILALSRKIVESVERTRRGDFSLEDLRGFDLRGKTIGVIGCGNIGRHVVKIANGFEMKILCFDIKKDEELIKKYNLQYVDLDYLLANSDIITLHLPLNEKTFHIINKKNISKIKKGSILINTARGGLIETEALLLALKRKILSAAALDVLEEECEIKEERQLLSRNFLDQLKKKCDLRVAIENHILIEQPNVIITPHNAFNSQEALLRIIKTDLENIKGFIEGKIRNSLV